MTTATAGILFHDEADRPAPLHTLEGLTRFLCTSPDEPDRLTPADYAALPITERWDYDRRRQLFLSGGIVIDTPHLQQARRMLRQCLTENLGRNSGHVGMMLSGDSTVGKTTTIKALMQYVHTAYVRQFPDYANHGRVPVVFIEVPAGCTGKLLMRAFAHFFGMTVARTDTMDMLRHRVVEMMNRVGVQVCVVDELHNVASKNRSNGETVDILKSLHNQVPATFIYSGIGLSSGELLSGPRGQQLAARFALLNMERFHPSSDADNALWTGIVEQFEEALPLLAHKRGTLVRLSNYLLARTNGSIGSLSRLINGAASDVVGTTEAITRELLDNQVLDHAAETANALTTRRRTRNTRATAPLTGAHK